LALFKREFIPLIAEGKKAQTRRLHRHTWQVGKTYKVRTDLFTSTNVKILILNKFQQRIYDMSTEDAVKEGLNSIEEFEEAWVRINKAWNPDLVVWVYKFKVC
jgi:hypothetical protein